MRLLSVRHIGSSRLSGDADSYILQLLARSKNCRASHPLADDARGVRGDVDLARFRNRRFLKVALSKHSFENMRQRYSALCQDRVHPPKPLQRSRLQKSLPNRHVCRITVKPFFAPVFHLVVAIGNASYSFTWKIDSQLRSETHDCSVFAQLTASHAYAKLPECDVATFCNRVF